jgi:hypothetical protein
MAILAFGLMLATKPALPHQFGNSLTAQHQPRVHASSNPPLDSIRLKKPLALLMLIQQPALLIRIAFTGQLNASKEFNGSRSDTFTKHQPNGLLQTTNYLAPSREESKERMMLSGRLSSTLSPSTPFWLPRATSKTGL